MLYIQRAQQRALGHYRARLVACEQLDQALGEDSGPFGCPQHPSVLASARVKAPLAQAQWKRPNRMFP
jgi:hypothetical protein